MKECDDLMKTLYLVRHCEATGQSPEAVLTEAGHQQALELASFFEDKVIHHIFTSTFIRAQHSIELTAFKKRLLPIVDNRLEERKLSSTDLPNWLKLLEDTFTDFDLKLSGGESSHEATVRAIGVVKEAPDNSVLVTHGNLMSLILKHFDDSFGFHEWKLLSNPDVYQITIKPDENMTKRIWPQ